MTKIKLSPVEKHLIRDFIIAILIQIAIIPLVVLGYKNSFPVDLSETETYEVTVDYTEYTSGGRRSEPKLYIKGTDSKLYVFTNLGFRTEPTPRQLYKMLSEGDHLTITCHKGFNIFRGIVYNILEVSRGNEVYRTYDQYVKSREGLPTLLIIFFSILELIFIFGVIIRFSSEKNTAKVIYRKIKKLHKTKNR